MSGLKFSSMFKSPINSYMCTCIRCQPSPYFSSILIPMCEIWKWWVCMLLWLKSCLVQKASLGSWCCGTRKLPMKSSLCALTDPIWREIRFTASAAPAQEDVTRPREISPDIAPELCWDFCDAADNFGSVRAKSVKVLWIFKVVERSQLDILVLSKDIQSLFTLM